MTPITLLGMNFTSENPETNFESRIDTFSSPMSPQKSKFMSIRRNSAGLNQSKSLNLADIDNNADDKSTLTKLVESDKKKPREEEQLRTPVIGRPTLMLKKFNPNEELTEESEVSESDKLMDQTFSPNNPASVHKRAIFKTKPVIIINDGSTKLQQSPYFKQNKKTPKNNNLFAIKLLKNRSQNDSRT